MVAAGGQFGTCLLVQGLRPLTQTKGKHVGQGSRGVENDVKLAGLEKQIPSSGGRSVCPSQSMSKAKEGGGIDEAKDGPNHKLSMVEADEGNDGLGDTGQKDGADKGSWNSP